MFFIFLLTEGSLGVVSPPRFCCGMFLLHDLGSWEFSSSSFTHVGAFSSGWEFVECEIHNFGFVVYMFPSCGKSFFIFLEAENFIFVMFLWLGLFPNDFCCISPMFSKLKIIFVFPSNLEERPNPIGCFC